VGRDTHEFAQATRRELGVAVQRDDVARACREAGYLTQIDERAGQTFGQRGDELLQLAALALPADPGLLAGTEAARPQQQDETRRAVSRVQRIQRGQLLQCLGQQRCVLRQLCGSGIGPVGQQRELRLRLGVGQVVQAQAVQQRQDLGILFRLATALSETDDKPAARRLLEGMLATPTAFPDRAAAEALLATLRQAG
jgi:hypothetical protein